MLGGSLQRRLLATMAAAFVVLLVVISVLLWNYARAAAERTYDLLLAGAALSILERVSIGPDGPTADLPTTAMDILSLAPDERVVYAVFAQGGEPVTGRRDLPLPDKMSALATSGTEQRFFTGQVDGTDFRFVLQGRALVSSAGREWIFVQVGQTLGARQVQERALFLTGLLGLAAVSLLGLGFVWLAIRSSLAPLHQIEADLRRRAPGDLSEIDGTPPQEIRGLWTAINLFIGRLRQSRTLTETFIADVAHQTRTSLSALVGHITLAADAEDFETMRNRVGRAERQAQRTVRLTNQLLANAMVIHRTDHASLDTIRLLPIVRETLADILRDVSMRSVTLTFNGDDLPEGADRIRGDAVSIREALRNLIDNAVRHGPEANHILVELSQQEETIVLSVEDAGPGIPWRDRLKATERFTSLSRTNGGSGLGLSIVRAVAEGHQARLCLGQSSLGGLSVSVAFPRLLAMVLAALVWAAPAARAETLEIWSATDTPAFAPILAYYEAKHPTVDVVYTEFHTVELHQAVLAAAPGEGPDLVISSAMDLQVDLVNRGLALRIDLPEALRPPDWAAWRSELFGFTFEPAAIVYNRATLTTEELPTSHRDLATFIRDNEDRLLGRIGGYDIRGSGIGYLYATQDAEQGLQAQRLTEVLGRAGLKTFCCTSDMVAGAADGELALAFNVIGSYALASAKSDPRIGIHFLDDFNLVMTRTAYVPKDANDPELAQAFLTFLLSPETQALIGAETPLIPINPAYFPEALAGPSRNYLPIRLGPGLLTYLDPIKRRDFLKGWEASLDR